MTRQKRKSNKRNMQQKTREETGKKENHITALRFQTREAYQTSPASFGRLSDGDLKKRGVGAGVGEKGVNLTFYL